ncbi:extracellular solute-binding protein [Vallitalea maricola]|uniref:Extracellular solute-binding protein n=1 Tax=Vallitalea maricola TaxID=3074433 RepID=A0ACB5UGA6_9FIRM|nr:extracellular solute-binding protein [Vallitalea sp. AN17-2]
MRRLIMYLSTIMIMALLLAGCQKEKQNDEDKQTNVEQTKGKNDTGSNDTLPEQKNPFFILSNQVKPGWPKDLKEDIIKQKIQESSGYEYRLEMYKGDDYITKLQLYLASGKYPDIWYAETPQQVAEWKEAGVIQPVGDLLQKYGKDLLPFINEKAIEGFSIDGELYVVPWGSGEGSINQPITQGLVIRKDWLDNLGYEIPETLDDYYKILKAFTYDDPDGNGEDDTYGLSGVVNKGSAFKMVFNAYGIDPEHWYERDGKLVLGLVTPEYKQAVATIRKWYEEGLIDKEFVVYNKLSEVEKKLIQEKVGSFKGHVWYTDSIWKVESALHKSNEKADFVMVPALEGPNGARGYSAPLIAKGGAVISAEAENPELIMDFLNWFGKDENYLIPHFGIEGEHWKWTDETKSKVEFIDDWGVSDVKFKAGIGNPNRIHRIEDRRHSSNDIIEAIENVNKYLLTNEFEGATPSMAKMSSLFETVVNPVFAKVVIGEESLEAIDAMQERWLSEGGQDIIDEVNAVWKK